MVSVSERDLLKAAKEFDSTTLAAIYDKYSSGIFRYALRLLGDESSAEECVSETFSRFLKVLSSNQGPDEHLQAYLYRIAHNWITDFYRRNAQTEYEMDEKFPAEESQRPENAAEMDLEKKQVRDALRNLTSDQRQVIYLRFIEGWSNEEVAAAVDKPVSAVKTLQHRALNTLKRLLVGNRKDRSDELE